MNRYYNHFGGDAPLESMTFGIEANIIDNLDPDTDMYDVTIFMINNEEFVRQILREMLHGKFEEYQIINTIFPDNEDDYYGAIRFEVEIVPNRGQDVENVLDNALNVDGDLRSIEYDEEDVPVNFERLERAIEDWY